MLSETELDAHASSTYRATLDCPSANADPGVASALREQADARYHADRAVGRDTLGFAFHALRRAGALKVVARGRRP